MTNWDGSGKHKLQIQVMYFRLLQFIMLTHQVMLLSIIDKRTVQPSVVKDPPCLLAWPRVFRRIRLEEEAAVDEEDCQKRGAPPAPVVHAHLLSTPPHLLTHPRPRRACSPAGE
jgi:hypothetical protein